MKASWLAKRLEGRLPAVFGKLSRQPYFIQPDLDELVPNCIGGRFPVTPPDAGWVGEYRVTTLVLETCSFYQLTR